MLDQLHNAQKPQVIIEKENERHRVILYLKAQGASDKRIAQITGMSNAYIGVIKKQSWFREKLVRMLEEKGGNLVENLIKVNAVDAVNVLEDLMHTAQNENVRAKCAVAFLDKVVGDRLNLITESKSKKPDELDEQIAALDEQMRILQGGNTNPDTARNADDKLEADSVVSKERETGMDAEESSEVLPTESTRS